MYQLKVLLTRQKMVLCISKGCFTNPNPTVAERFPLMTTGVSHLLSVSSGTYYIMLWGLIVCTHHVLRLSGKNISYYFI